MQTEARLQAAGNKAAARPEFAEVLDRVAKMRPEIASRALASEKAKRVPAETMEALRDTGVFRLMQPKRFGGYEYGPAELAQIGFELGRACGSTGWCGTLAVCFGWMTAFLPLEAQEEVWKNPDNLLAVSYVPTPKVEAVDGGFKISGSWPWASGVDSAVWLILAAMLPGTDCFGYPTFGPTALVAPIVGMAQGALDAFTETARGARRMVRPGVFEKVAESALIQSLVGQAAARIDAARTLMLTSLQEGQEVVQAGGTLEIEQRVRIRRNHGFAARTSSEVVNDIFAKSGAAAADENSRVQRFWRDANARGTTPKHRLGYALCALRCAATGAATSRNILRRQRPGDRRPTLFEKGAQRVGESPQRADVRSLDYPSRLCVPRTCVFGGQHDFVEGQSEHRRRKNPPRARCRCRRAFGAVF